MERHYCLSIFMMVHARYDSVAFRDKQRRNSFLFYAVNERKNIAATGTSILSLNRIHLVFLYDSTETISDRVRMVLKTMYVVHVAIYMVE